MTSCVQNLGTWASTLIGLDPICLTENSFFPLMVSSDFQKITCGVLQGRLLGPLYLYYSNDMQFSLSSKLLLYTDDNVILVSIKDPQVAAHEFSNDLNSCNQWLTDIDNQLSLHVGKTECILFDTHAKLNKARITIRSKSLCSISIIGIIMVKIFVYFYLKRPLIFNFKGSFISFPSLLLSIFSNYNSSS